jgi:uncharacterized protein (TIGR02246 family)
MNRIIAVLVGFAVACLSASSWAGPAEEVAQIAVPRVQAFQDGNIDAFVAAYADDAVFHSSFTAFRIDGREAIKNYFNELFLLYPRRHLFNRQPVVRVYNDDLVVQDGYTVLSLQNERGDTKIWDTRYTVVWAKIGGRWQIVAQHVSRSASAP